MPSPQHTGKMPVAPRSRAWDAGAARARLAKWASSDGSGDKDKIDWGKYGKGFAYYPAGAKNIGDYKLPHHDIINGALTLVPRGLFAAMVRFDGTEMPRAERGTVQGHLRGHYRRDLKMEPPDANSTIAYAMGEMDYDLTAEELTDEGG